MAGWLGRREFNAFQPWHENAGFHLGLLALVTRSVAQAPTAPKPSSGGARQTSINHSGIQGDIEFLAARQVAVYADRRFPRASAIGFPNFATEIN